jgi:hypothetical protein
MALNLQIDADFICDFHPISKISGLSTQFAGEWPD